MSSRRFEKKLRQIFELYKQISAFCIKLLRMLLELCVRRDPWLSFWRNYLSVETHVGSDERSFLTEMISPNTFCCPPMKLATTYVMNSRLHLPNIL